MSSKICSKQFTEAALAKAETMSLPYIASLNPELKGYFVQIDKACAIVSENFKTSTALPLFVQSYRDTVIYIKEMDGSFKQGELYDKEVIQNKMHSIFQ